MQHISPTTKSYFIYFASYANTVLGCTNEIIKTLFPDSNFCDLDYYDNTNGCHDINLEVRIDGAYLLCGFDEAGKCDACYVFFDTMDDVDNYIELCNQLFEYKTISKSWQLLSTFIMYIEEEEERYLGFFAKKV